MAVKFHQFLPEIAVYRRDAEWKKVLQGLSPAESCEVVAKCLADVKQTARATFILSERDWFEQERPYYNVWPSVFEMIENVDLDIPMKYLSIPYSSMAICFADGTPYGLASCLVSVRKYSENSKDLVAINLVGNVELNGEVVNVWRFGVLNSNESFSLFARVKNEDDDKWERMDSDSVMSEKQESEIIRLMCHIFCGVSILASDSTLVQPIVLNRDMLKYKNADEATKKYLEDRASRLNGRGFSIGKDLETELMDDKAVSPHIRKPHLALFWTGKGRTVPVLKLRRGAYVHRSEVTTVPTGFMDRETQPEQPESDYQTLEQWMDGYEAAIESGQSNISRDEAEKRYHKKYGKQPRHQNGDW